MGIGDFEKLAKQHQAKEDNEATLHAIDLRVRAESGGNLEQMQQRYQRLLTDHESKTKSEIRSRIIGETGTNLGSAEGVKLVEERTLAEWNNLVKNEEGYEGGLVKRINDIKTEIQRRADLQKKFEEINGRLKPLWAEESRILGEIKDLEEVHHLNIPPSLLKSLNEVREQITSQTNELSKAFPGDTE